MGSCSYRDGKSPRICGWKAVDPGETVVWFHTECEGLRTSRDSDSQVAVQVKAKGRKGLLSQL